MSLWLQEMILLSRFQKYSIMFFKVPSDDYGLFLVLVLTMITVLVRFTSYL